VPSYMVQSDVGEGITNEYMVEDQTISTTTPLFSIVIAAYNDWAALDQCLRSISQEMSGPSFEVIVVDDGSNQAAPDVIRQWARSLPLNIVRQSHAGISAARNRGIQISKGSILLFVDADCRVQKSCLLALAETIAGSSQHNCFQLRLIGDSSKFVGRAEDLRLKSLQSHLLQSDGRIRYLNTAGFAIRRTSVNIEEGLFDPLALRAEDTLLLANLMESGELPLFVANATVQHAIGLSIARCLLKDVRSALLEGRTYDVIAEKPVKIRVTHRERLSVLAAMWTIAGQRSIGRSAWFVLVGRQTLQRIVSFCRACLRTPLRKL
jgi:glycosyltransferase involved in cell wall biosynthesis